jgi:hypothetical protein
MLMTKLHQCHTDTTPSAIATKGRQYGVSRHPKGTGGGAAALSLVLAAAGAVLEPPDSGLEQHSGLPHLEKEAGFPLLVEGQSAALMMAGPAIMGAKTDASAGIAPELVSLKQ